MLVKNYNEFINEMAKFVDTTTELADDEYRVFIVEGVVDDTMTDMEFMELAYTNGYTISLDELVGLWNGKNNEKHLLPGNSTMRILPQVIYTRKIFGKL